MLGLCQSLDDHPDTYGEQIEADHPLEKRSRKPVSLFCSDDRSDDGRNGHDRPQRQIVGGESLLPPATFNAQHDDEEADDGVGSGRLFDRKPEDMQEDRDAELTAAHADQACRRTDDDAGQKAERAASAKRRLYLMDAIYLNMVWLDWHS